MANTQDRIRKRRQYVKKKGAAYTKLGLAALVSVPFTALAVLLLIATVYVISLALFDRSTDASITILPGCICGFMFVLAGVAAFYSGILARQAQKAAKQLPYAPPVTARSLPAEEVLVRGSTEPAQEQGKVLLRGTDGSAGADERQLLRGSQGEGRK